jgi:hypothetical protein
LQVVQPVQLSGMALAVQTRLSLQVMTTQPPGPTQSEDCSHSTHAPVDEQTFAFPLVQSEASQHSRHWKAPPPRSQHWLKSPLH